MYKLYYDNEYLKSFEAEITDVMEPEDGIFGVRLSRTAFYPEGGGQPADLGRIGEMTVVDVQKDGEDVLHLVKPSRADVSPVVGLRYQCEIDWNRRYDYMQQHTGQHLISAVAYREYGADTVAVHQGDEYTTIEFALEQMSRETIRGIEDRCHEFIDDALPVHSAVYDEATDAEALAALDLRREPKVSGSIRVVSIGHYDSVACGGVHTHSTGELVMLHCIGTERIRGRVRTIWKIGRRAREDYRRKSLVTLELVDLLSTPVLLLPQRVSALEEGARQTRYELEQARRRIGADIARRALSESAEMDRESGLTKLAVGFENEDRTVFRATAEQLAAEGTEALLAVCTNEVGGKLHWIIVGRGVELDQTRLRSEILALIDGKGGGKPPMYQGVGEKPSGREDFINAVLQEA